MGISRVPISIKYRRQLALHGLSTVWAGKWCHAVNARPWKTLPRRAARLGLVDYEPNASGRHKVILWPVWRTCHNQRKKRKVLPKPHRPMGRRWSLFPQPSARHQQLMLRDYGYGASASRGVPVDAPGFAGTKLNCLVSEAHRTWTTCPRLLLDSVGAGTRTSDHWITSPTVRCPSSHYTIESPRWRGRTEGIRRRG